MQAFWNAKFQTPNLIYGEAPNNFVKENVALFKNMRKVLCLGEGEGRNALFLAKLGLEVEALDASDVALFKLQKRAQEEHLFITLRHTLLEYWSPEPLYDAVVCTYLHLPKNDQKELFKKSLQALKTGGLFIAELFSESQLLYSSGGPKERELLYEFDTTLNTLKSLPCTILKLAQEMVTLNEGEKHNGRASVIRIILEKKN